MADAAPLPPHSHSDVPGPTSGNPNAKLYVGRLPRNADKRDLEDLFGKYGRVVSLDLKQGGFAFVEYEDQRDAEDAIAALNNFPFEGERISVEWSRRSANASTSTCFICNNTGHWARECPENREQGLDVRSGKCFKCGQPGHLARFCRGEGQRPGGPPGYDRGYDRGGYDRGYDRRDPYYRGGPPPRRYDDYRRSPDRGGYDRGYDRAPYPPRGGGYDRYDDRRGGSDYYDDRRPPPHDYRGGGGDRGYDDGPRQVGYPRYDDRGGDSYYRGGSGGGGAPPVSGGTVGDGFGPRSGGASASVGNAGSDAGGRSDAGGAPAALNYDGAGGDRN
ncbi:hypothetical protein HDU79_010767 [Rhizoclosmatium sp. JEL0117]|nr:hypothetical protein HDU99_007191 [Rhizoclosmatium hyalinum]KAJ3294565.1 hypothetical protein HDU79_010767 [Rhizoclosmatium sp. JEL0117]